MTGRHRVPRVVSLVVFAALLVAGCGERSNIDPDAAVAVDGSFVGADGTPLADRPVRLGSGVTVAEGGFGVLTVGLSCFGGGCSGDFFDTTTDDTGGYRFDLTGEDTQSTFGEATSFLLSTSAAPPEGRPSGPSVAARFVIQATSLTLPTLTLADARPELSSLDNGRVRTTWDGAATPGPYALTFFSDDGTPIWETTATEAVADIDARILEDVTGLATVSTTRTDAIEGSSFDIETRSSGIGFRGGVGPPDSRGAACELRGGGGAVHALPTCVVTDGDLAGAGPPAFVCSDTEETSTTACPPARRIRVRLDQPTAAQLVVVRGCATACRVVAHGEGGQTHDAGAVSARFGAVRLDERPVTAVDVIAEDVSAVREVSVWSAVEATDALLPLGDPGDILDGGSDDERRLLRTVGIAIALAALAAVVLGLGVVIGRRSRQ